MYPLVTWVLVLMAVSWVGGCGPAAFDCIQAGIMRTTRRPNWLPQSPGPGSFGTKGQMACVSNSFMAPAWWPPCFASRWRLGSWYSLHVHLTAAVPTFMKNLNFEDIALLLAFRSSVETQTASLLQQMRTSNLQRRVATSSRKEDSC